MNTIAVTDRKNHSDSLVLAKAAAERLGIPFVDRKKASLADLRASYGVDNILIAKNHFCGQSISNIIIKVNSSLRQKVPTSMMLLLSCCNQLAKT